jgi:DNA-binding HxlR family transcriptional regulator
VRKAREKSQVFAKSLQKSMPEIRKSCLTRDLQRLQILEFILTVMAL